MVNQRKPKDSSATTTTNNNRRRGQVPEEELDIESKGNNTPFCILLKPFLATPNPEDV
jgi:hypothetical protein